MNFKVECKTCQSRLAIPEELWHKRFAGRLQGLKCKKCGDVITVDDRPKESSGEPTASSEAPNEPAGAAETAATETAKPEPATPEPVVQAETAATEVAATEPAATEVTATEPAATEPAGTAEAPPVATEALSVATESPPADRVTAEAIEGEAPKAPVSVTAQAIEGEAPKASPSVTAEPIEGEAPKAPVSVEAATAIAARALAVSARTTKARPVQHEAPKEQASVEAAPKRAVESKKGVKLAPALARPSPALGPKRTPSFSVSRPGAAGATAVALAPRPALDSTPAHSEPVPKRSQLETPAPPEVDVEVEVMVANARLPEMPPAPLPRLAPASPRTVATGAPPLALPEAAEPDTLARSSWAASVEERATDASSAPVPPSPASSSMPFPGAPTLGLPSLSVASTPVPARTTSSTAAPLLGAAPPPPPRAAARALSVPGGVAQAPVATPLSSRRSRRGWVVAAVGLGALVCAVPAVLFALHLGPFAPVAAATPELSKPLEIPLPAEPAVALPSSVGVADNPSAEVADEGDAPAAAPSSEAAASAQADAPSVSPAPDAEPAPPELADPESYEARILTPFVHQLMERVSHCHEGGRANGTALLTLKFAPSGKVIEARLEGEPIASAPVSRCILAHARALILPAFQGDAIEVTRSLTLE